MDRFTSRLITGIRFADYVFAEPVPLGPCWISLQMTGIYAVLVPDPTWGPRQFQPIFFGVCNSQRPCPLSVDEYNACLRAASGKALYIAMYNLPVHDPSESNRIQWELIHVYSPLCNRDSGDSHSAEFARMLEALEKKNQEHEVLLKVLLAAIGHPAQPPQEIKRRAVGFQPVAAGKQPLDEIRLSLDQPRSGETTLATGVSPWTGNCQGPSPGGTTQLAAIVPPRTLFRRSAAGSKH